ncbi:Protein of uncharacterised function (DUF2637) [Mycobacteroides abscessus]|nr:DUF2637 domain-containing protein [Mycobacteroides abscessus]CPZ10060.1 Protein of uncharacterised function (DUF2637) [Mycobacteroides abscessus]
MITHSGGATRFFWSWLIGSAAFSILGVVTHAVLGNARSSLIASVLAVGIVVIQLCATYGVHALVQERITGAAYRWALAIAVALALGAFVLNFVALQDLVITWAGTAPAIAWIVPLIIDLGMTASTLAILALTEAQPPSSCTRPRTLTHKRRRPFMSRCTTPCTPTRTPRRTTRTPRRTAHTLRTAMRT